MDVPSGFSKVGGVAINFLGVAAGNATGPAQRSRPFTFDYFHSTGTVLLPVPNPDPATGPDYVAAGINDSGDVVGSAQDPGGLQSAALPLGLFWPGTGGQPQTIASHLVLTDINNCREMVGINTSQGADGALLIYPDGFVRDLSLELPGNGQYTASRARSVQAAGWVGGSAADVMTGLRHGFAWRPDGGQAIRLPEVNALDESEVMHVGHDD